MLPILDGEFFSGEVNRALLGVFRFGIFDENDNPDVPENVNQIMKSKQTNRKINIKYYWFMQFLLQNQLTWC